MIVIDWILGPKVLFKDAALERAVHYALKPHLSLSGSRAERLPALRERKLRRIKSLDCSGQPIHSLEGIECFTMLESLSLSGTGVSDLTPLAGLENLQTLDVSKSRVNNIDAIKRIPNLTHLNLGNTSVRDLSELEAHPSLKSIDLAGCDISNYWPVRELDVVNEFVFEDENLEATIRVVMNKPEGPIHNEDFETEYQDLGAFNGSNTYYQLSIAGRDIRSLKGLERYTWLRTLTLDNNKFTDLSPLANLHNLRNLSLTDNNLDDISILRQLKSLRSLDVVRNNIRDVSGLSPEIEGLYIDSNPIDDIATVARYTNLEHLSISEIELPDLSFLRPLSRLEYLDISSTKVSDISPLSTLKNLDEVDLEGNRITDFTPVRHVRDVSGKDWQEFD